MMFILVVAAALGFYGAFFYLHRLVDKGFFFIGFPVICESDGRKEGERVGGYVCVDSSAVS